MSPNVDAERWCEAIVHSSSASRPDLCNAPAYDFCAECGRALCQEHSTFCPKCEGEICPSCEHECALSLAKPPQSAATATPQQQVTTRLFRWMLSVARPRAVRKPCPYCREMMTPIGVNEWLCGSCRHVERQLHVSFLEDSKSGVTRSCTCAKCRAARRAVAA